MIFRKRTCFAAFTYTSGNGASRPKNKRRRYFYFPFTQEIIRSTLKIVTCKLAATQGYRELKVEAN